MTDLAPRRADFRKLHESGCFAIPNPWDIGTARYLRHLGFPALATTSSGFSFSRALPDTDWAVPRDMALAHIAEIVRATDLPVNADFESGYAHDPEEVAHNVGLCVDSGVAGCRSRTRPGIRETALRSRPRGRAHEGGAQAHRRAGEDVLLTGRAECYLVGTPTAERVDPPAPGLCGAGADVLYAPGPAQARRHQGPGRGGRPESRSTS
jgi:2-methylisocitrate lyase-like PEP mutase family enzyme